MFTHSTEILPDGTHRVLIQMDLKNKRVIDDNVFDSPEKARQYLLNTMLSWLRCSFENWVHHKKHIIEANGGHKNANTMQALGRCIAFYSWAATEPMIDRIAKYALTIKPHLYAILPHPNNSSYANALQQLDELLAWCTDFINTEKQKTQTAA